MNLHYAYHKWPGHETDRYTAMRHAIQDLIDQSVDHLSQSSVTTNPLPAHTTHAIHPLTDGIHFLDFAKLDDHIYMLSQDDSDPEPIVSDGIYEIGKVNLGPQMPTPFRLFSEAASVQTTTIDPLTFLHYNVTMSFVLVLDIEEVQTPYVDVSQAFDIQYILCGGRVLQQPPPTTARPLEGTSAPKEVRRDDNEILRQLQNT